MEREKVYETFLNKWGYVAQSRMAIEEMSELIKELCKYERYKDDKEKVEQILANIKEENADVLNTVEQLSYYFGQEEVEVIRNQKIERALKKVWNSKE